MIPENPEKLLGSYGMYNSALANLEKCFDDVASCKHLTGMRQFINNPWTQFPIGDTDDKENRLLYAVVYDEKKEQFITNEPNEKYYDRFGLMLNLAGERGMTLEIVIHDIYFHANWKKYLPFKKHPYTDNDKAVDYRNNAKAVYDGLTFPETYYAIRWHAASKRDDMRLNYQYFLNDSLGVMFTVHRDRITQLIKDTLTAKNANGKLKYPKLKIIFQLHNEKTVKLAKDGHPSSTNSIGDRPELHAWWIDRFMDLGIVRGKRFIPSVNIDMTDPFMEERPEGDKMLNFRLAELNESITGPYGLSQRLNAYHEMHFNTADDVKKTIDGVNSVEDETGYVFNELEFIASGDGMVKPNKVGHPQFKIEWQKFVKLPYHTDLLYEEAIISNPTPAKPFRWMDNWNKCMPTYKQWLEEI